jgi:2-polyprenyl-6-hydroxyphenyl methylase / 3-demethylubiquinone-9 3-methyltransferase
MEKNLSRHDQVDNSIYDKYGDKWYTADDDPIALLRHESKAKTPWVLEKIRQNFKDLSAIKILDVGCGGGFLSNDLAKAGLTVTGLDASPESLKVAAAHDETKSVKYIVGDAYQLPFEDASIDVVTAMDFLEHVEDPEKVIQEISRVLKPKGLFIFHTFNRNLLAYVVIIKFVEWFIQNTPKNLHVLRLFIKPSELAKYCQNHKLHVSEMVGIRPSFSTIPLKNYFSGTVPQTMKFKLTKSLLLSYMGCAKRK